MINNPEDNCEEMNFLELVSWCKTFHIVRPIVPGNLATDAMIAGWHEMIQLSNIPVVVLEEILKCKDRSLVSCSCKTYLHYLFCKHTYLILR